MLWIIRLSSEAEKQLARLPRDRQEVIARSIDRMRSDPFQGNVKPLRGREWKGRYRKAVGRYRLVFLPDYSEHIVEISQILLRAEKTYR